MAIKELLKSFLPSIHGAAQRIWRAFFGAYNSAVKKYYPLHKFKEKISGYKNEKEIIEKEIGKKVNIKSPKTINEKIVWKKINERNPLLVKTSDKYEVRKYVKEKLGSKAKNILIPLIDVVEEPKKLNLLELDTPYVIPNTENHYADWAVPC